MNVTVSIVINTAAKPILKLAPLVTTFLPERDTMMIPR